jgi:hypothetical protein
MFPRSQVKHGSVTIVAQLSDRRSHTPTYSYRVQVLVLTGVLLSLYA